MLERIDRYELEERVGVGGQTTVYLVEQMAFQILGNFI